MDGTPTHQTATTRVWYLQTAADTGGELHEQRIEYLPGSPFPPFHFHPSQDEHFEIESGEMIFVVAGVESRVGPGESIDIPRGTHHKARNASETEPAVARWETRPALRTGEFFTCMAKLEGQGTIPLAAAVHSYRDVYRMPGLQGLAVPVIARLASLLGRRPEC